MNRGSPTKAALAREVRNLRNYERFSPSLDLKRRQLTAERARSERRLQELRAEAAALRTQTARAVPMLADEDVDLTGLVRVIALDIGKEARLGVDLPVLRDVVTEIAAYGLMATPHWVDYVAEALARAARLEIAARVEAERSARFRAAVKRATQRLNLFEKVLIPQARTAIKRIRIHLSDAEMAGMARSKAAKSKRAEAGAP